MTNTEVIAGLLSLIKQAQLILNEYLAPSATDESVIEQLFDLLSGSEQREIVQAAVDVLKEDEA